MYDHSSAVSLKPQVKARIAECTTIHTLLFFFKVSGTPYRLAYRFAGRDMKQSIHRWTETREYSSNLSTHCPCQPHSH